MTDSFISIKLPDARLPRLAAERKSLAAVFVSVLSASSGILFVLRIFGLQ